MAIPTPIEPFTDVSSAAVRGWADFWLDGVRRGRMPWEVTSDVGRWWTTMTDRSEPTWSTPHEVVWETPLMRLRDFSAGTIAGTGAEGGGGMVPTLVLPPQAGHDSSIVDYSPDQSQMQTVLASGLTRAYAMDWVGATQATKHATIDGYLADVERAVRTIGGPVNLIGDCQGGWLAAIYAALHPQDVHTLTIAGAPIDFHVGDPVIGGYVELLPRAFYEAIVAGGGGVLKGEYLLGGFIAIKPQDEVSRQLGLLSHLDDAEHLDRYRHFEDWFKHTQDLAGDFYLWIVEHLFRRNALVTGELEIGGERVDLQNISCPLLMLAGETDHITPPPQVFAARDHVASEVVVERTASGGHLGLFMGREALRDHWPPVLAEVARRSGVPDAGPEVVVAAGHAPEQPVP